MNKARIAVLVSGGGTNLQALIDAQAAGIIKSGEITLVISNKKGAYALERAAKAGKVPERDMFNTFNMGVGMSITVHKEDAEKALEILRANGEDAYFIGEIVKSSDGVKIELL